MKMAPVADVKSKFSMYLRDSESDPVVITRNGRPVAVILSVVDEDDLMDILLTRSTRLRTILEESWQQIVQEKGIPHDQFWEEVNAGYEGQKE